MADLNIAISLTSEDRASASLDKVSASLRGVEGAAGSATGPLQRIGELIGGGIGLAVGIKLVDAFTASLKGLGDATVGMNANLEQSSIAFTTMLGSAEKAQAFLLQLQQFAATTPFEFKELVPQAQRLRAMGFAAEEVIPLLRDVGNTASAMGTGQVGIDRITLALGQMNAATKVHAQDLHQLTEAGVPAWQLLADAVGKTTAETMKDVEQGRIASDVFIKAFHDFTEANFGSMMEQQSRTFIGAMSNISDVTQQTLSRAFQPFFEVLRDGAVTLADFLQGAGFQQWATAFQVGLAAIMGKLREFGGLFAPLGEAIRAAFTFLTETGNVSGALAMLRDQVGAALQGLLGQVQTFAHAMFGAGVDLVTTFADGMFSAAGSVLQNAVSTIAGTIAGFLIGHSPPEQGPLREIATGGRTLMETYGQGMQGGLDPVRQAVAGVSQAFEAAGTNLGALKEIGTGVEAQIREIGRAAHDVDAAISATKDTIRDIKDAYTAQLEPLEAQHKALTSQRDTTAELARLGDDLALTLAQQAEAEARGDSEARARLSTQLDLVRQVGDEARIGQQLIETQNKLNDLQQDSLKFQLERNRLTEEGTRLQAALQKASVPDPRFAEQLMQAQQRLSQLQQPDPRFGERESALETRLQELQGGGGPAQAALEAFRQALAARQAQQQLRTATTPQARQAALVAQQEAALQRAAAAERQQEEIARVKAQQEVLAREKADAEAKRAQEIADAQRRIDQINREAQLNAEERARQAAAATQGLIDLDLKRQQLDRQEEQQQAIAGYQQAQLEAQRDGLALQLQMIDLADKPALAEALEMENVIKAHDAATQLVQKRFDTENKILDLPIKTQIQAIKDEQTQVLQPLQAQLESLDRQKQNLAEQRTAWSEVKGEITAAEQAARALEAANKAAAAAAPRAGTGLPSLAINTPENIIAAQEAGQKLAAALGTGMQEWLQEHSGELIGTGLGVALGGIAFGPLGAVAGAALGAAIAQRLQEAFAAEDIDFASTLQARMGEAADALGGIFAALHGAWDTLVDALTQIGAFDDLREAWNLLATDVGPKLSDLLGGMGPLMQTLATIAGEVLVLAIKGVTESVLLTVKAWDVMVTMAKTVGDAFNGLSGLMQAASATLNKAWSEDWGGMRTAVETVVTWLTETALPAITTFLTTGATQIQTFAANAAESFRKGIAQWQTVFTTDLGTLDTNVVTQITKVGGDIVAGLSKGITDRWEGFKSGLGNQLQDLVTFLRGPQGIDAHSPSQLFSAMVGEPIGEGIMAGAETAVAAGIPALVAQTQSMVDTLGAITQAARDKAVADAREAQAAAMAGIAAVQALAQAGGGSAYPSGGLPQAPGSTPGGAGAPGTGGILLGLGGGPNSGGGSSGTGGHAVGGGSGGSGGTTGSGLEAWHISAPGLNPTQIYGNSAPGYGPIITQPTTTSLFGGPGSAPSGGLAPTGPPANLWNPYANPPPGWTVDEWYNWLNGTGPSAPAADTAGGGKAPLIVNQTISVTGTSPDELIRQNDLWLDRAQWQAGIG